MTDTGPQVPHIIVVEDGEPRKITVLRAPRDKDSYAYEWERSIRLVDEYMWRGWNVRFEEFDGGHFWQISSEDGRNSVDGYLQQYHGEGRAAQYTQMSDEDVAEYSDEIRDARVARFYVYNPKNLTHVMLLEESKRDA